jgi:hypothetical protein
VGLRTDDGRLLVIVTGTGEVIAEHVLVAPGEASVRDEHYGGPRPAPQRAVRPKTAAEKAFCALGPAPRPCSDILCCKPTQFTDGRPSRPSSRAGGRDRSPGHLSDFLSWSARSHGYESVRYSPWDSCSTGTAGYRSHSRRPASSLIRT